MNTNNSNPNQNKFKEIISLRTDKMVDSFLEEKENLEKPTIQQSEKIFSGILNDIQSPKAIEGNRMKYIANTMFMHRKQVAAAIFVFVSIILSSLWLKPDNYYIKTNFAENKKIDLPDGSTVILNANSSLTYSKNWDAAADRKVWLEGEGYFSVKKGIVKGQKFEVVAKDVSVIVQGTMFNVNARKDKVEIFLEEGKISLITQSDKNSPKVMEPGDFVSYLPKLKELKLSQKLIENKNVSSWKDGALIFQDANLSAVLKKLNEIYGVDFEIEDQDILNIKITAGIPVEQLDVAIIMLSDVLEVEIEAISKTKYKLK
jgi:ferric-dicitrate binding protein FerR (iron transport regulator)